MIIPGRLLRVQEVADQLGLRVSTVRKMLRHGKLPTVRPAPRAVRVPQDAVSAWITLHYHPARGSDRTLGVA
jgi:excisionase family DNA binding protein